MQTLDDFKKEKFETEEAIFNIISSFQEKYGCRVKVQTITSPDYRGGELTKGVYLTTNFFLLG